MLDNSGDKQRADIPDRLSKFATDHKQIQHLQSLGNKEGGIEEATTFMQEYLNRATAMLAEYDESEYRASMVNLCAYVAQRDK